MKHQTIIIKIMKAIKYFSITAIGMALGGMLESGYANYFVILIALALFLYLCVRHAIKEEENKLCDN